jgi:hypothetical protein
VANAKVCEFNSKTEKCAKAGSIAPALNALKNAAQCKAFEKKKADAVSGLDPGGVYPIA